VVDVRAGTVELNNQGSTLAGSDIVLAAATNLTIGDGSSIVSDGSTTRGIAPLLVSGDGALVRVSSDPGAAIIRTNRSDAPTVPPLLTVGAGTQLGGGSVILDSTHATHLDASATLNTRALTLGSGRISIQLSSSGVDLSGSQSLGPVGSAPAGRTGSKFLDADEL
jgi:hypothetical protein